MNLMAQSDKTHVTILTYRQLGYGIHQKLVINTTEPKQSILFCSANLSGYILAKNKYPTTVYHTTIKGSPVSKQHPSIVNLLEI